MYRFTGNKDAGEHYYGIPARDLTDEEYDALEPEHKELVGNGVLYAKDGPQPAAPVPVRTMTAPPTPIVTTSAPPFVAVDPAPQPAPPSLS